MLFAKKQFIFLMLSLYIIPQLSFAASPGMRPQTLRDFMDELMRTNNVALLKKHKPHKIHEAKGYKIWYTTPLLPNGKTRCLQAIIIDKTEKIVGWDTDCPDIVFRTDNEVSAKIPIPKPVVPSELHSLLKVAKAEQYWEGEAVTNVPKYVSKYRSETLADRLESQMGQSEESILTKHSNLDSSERLENGKTIRAYSLYWGDHVRRSCKYYIFTLKGVMVGYNAQDCLRAGTELDRERGVDAAKPPAPWSK